ncbi:DMT family transporter [Propionibacteriaceae bacterium Y1700]|uniref:DMT family transporter n=1 Tax=Microlunatus sp. Y1700 TaxID=3418487 RepID=UPI003DA77805
MLAAFVSGGAVALQSRVNGELAHRVDDGYLAALISFGTGLVLIGLATAPLPSGRRGVRAVITALRTRSHPWWLFAGGACGALLVLSQGLTVTLLGVALFTVAVVAGQTLSGLVIDRRGLGTMPGKRLTVPRVIGTGLALVAVVVAMSANLSTDVPWWLLIMPFVAGLGIAYQQAANGQVRQLSSVAAASLGNFVVGTTVLAIAFGVHVLAAGPPGPLPSEPWLYVGGAIGVLFIALNAAIVKWTGVLLLGLTSLGGQLTGSVLLDLVAPAPGHQLPVTTVIGAVLTLIAVVITALPQRRPAGR